MNENNEKLKALGHISLAFRRQVAVNVGPWLTSLLLQTELPPTTCPKCDSSANSPLAVFCGTCSSPLTNKLHKWIPWGAGVSFVILSGIAGCFQFPFGLYAIVTFMYALMGAAMLRRYTSVQRFFITLSLLLFVLMYAAIGSLEALLATISDGTVWHGCSWVVAMAFAVMACILITPLDAKRSSGIGGGMILIIVTIGVGGGIVYWASGVLIPWWSIVTLGMASVLLAMISFSLTFAEGFRVQTRRPGVIVEATRPFEQTARPKPELHDYSSLSVLRRAVAVAGNEIAWSGRLSVYYILSGLIQFANTFSYWSLLIVDLLLRSVVRAWRRFIELAKILRRVAVDAGAFAVQTAQLLILSILFPIIAIAASAFVATTLSQTSYTYIRSGGVTSLFLTAIFAVMLFGLYVIAIAFLVRQHRTRVVLGEAFQTFSYCFPFFVLLLYATSILLSLYCRLIQAGPFQFGPLTILLTVVLIGLFGWIFFRKEIPPRRLLREGEQQEEETVASVLPNENADHGGSAEEETSLP